MIWDTCTDFTDCFTFLGARLFCLIEINHKAGNTVVHSVSGADGDCRAVYLTWALLCQHFHRCPWMYKTVMMWMTIFGSYYSVPGIVHHGFREKRTPDDRSPVFSLLVGEVYDLCLPDELALFPMATNHSLGFFFCFFVVPLKKCSHVAVVIGHEPPGVFLNTFIHGCSRCSV